MSDDVQPAPRAAKPWRFSFATLLLVVTIACLATALVLSQRRLAEVEQQLESLQPMSANQVAKRFEESTTLGPLKTVVKDVRYSEKEDAYRVRFSWTDATTQKTWTSDVKLVSDGFGVYVGVIRNRPFTAPIGAANGFTVAVFSPSALITSGPDL